MTRRVYLQPVDPRVNASGWFDLIVRDQAGACVSTRSAGADIHEAIAALPDDLARAAGAQWNAHRADSARAWSGYLSSSVTVMGILNVTPDSFSDGGLHRDLAEMLSHGSLMQAAGAAIIDVGGESTRPGAQPVPVDEELRRVVPIVERLAAAGGVVSVDTRRSEVMAAALIAGAAIINDVSALRHDPRGFDVIAAAGCPIVLMHAPGPPDDLHANARYRDVALDVYDFLAERRDAAIAHGIAADRIILDPGIGFGKSPADNLALMRDLPLLRGLGCPLLVGASRKRMIAAIAGSAATDRRLGGSLALALAALNGGAALLRVHDVAETVQAAAVWAALRGQPRSGARALVSDEARQRAVSGE